MPARKGFTLIETLIYIALVGVLLVGVLTIAHSLLTGAERMANASVAQSEAAFMLSKMSAALEIAGEVSIDFEPPYVTLEGKLLNATRAPVKAFVLEDKGSLYEVEFDIGTEHIGPVRMYKHL